MRFFMKFSLLLVFFLIAVSIYSHPAFGIEKAGLKTTVSQYCGPRLAKRQTALPNLILQDVYCCSETVDRAACLEKNIATMEKLNNYLDKYVVSRLSTIYDGICPLGSMLTSRSVCRYGMGDLTESEIIRILEEEMACFISDFNKLMERNYFSRIDEMKECTEKREECEERKLNIRNRYINSLKEVLSQQRECYEQNLEMMTAYMNELNRIVTRLARRATLTIPPPPLPMPCHLIIPDMEADPLCP